MAVTISVTADTSQATQAATQLSANLSSAFGGIQNQLKQMETASGQATSKMSSGLQQLSQATIRATTPQGDLSRALLQTGKAAETQLSSFEKLRQQYTATAQSSRTLVSSLKDVASSFGVVLGVTAVVEGLRRFGTAMVDAALTMDTARLSLAAVTGSTTAAAKELTALRAIADQTGVGVDVLAKQWAGLYAAVNQVPGRLEVTRTVFANIIEVAARLGKTTDQIGNALYGFTQIAGGATLQLQDFNQIVDALPGVFPALAREMNLTQSELRDLIGQGKIMVDDVLPKMGTAIASLAQGNGPVATLQSVFGRLSTAWTDFLDAIGQLGPILALRTAVIGLTGALQGFAAAARDAKAAIFGADQATVVANALQTIQGKLDTANASLENMKKASTTGIGGLVNQLMGLDQQTAIATKEQEIANLIAAQTALRQSSEVLAAGPSATDKQRTELLKFLQDLKKTPADVKRAIDDINKQLSAIQSGDVTLLKALGLDPNDPQFTQQSKAFSDTLIAEREKLQDQLLGIDRKASARAGKEAESEAKRRAALEQQVMEQSLKTQEALIAESFDERRRLIDERFSEELTRAPLREKELSALRASELQTATVEEARFIEQVRIESLNRQLLTAEEFAAKREAIIKRTGEVELKASQQTLQQQIKDAQDLVSLTDRVNEQILDRDEKMQAERTRQLERELDKQEQAYERFGEQVVGFLDSIFQGLLTGTLNAVDFFKTLLIRQLSNIAANVLGPLITSLSSSLVGGIAGILPGGLGGAIQGALGIAGAAGVGKGLGLTEGVGLLASMKTIAGAFTNGLGGLTDAMINAGSTISTFFGGPALGTGFSGVEVGGAIDVGAGSTAGTVLGGLGGAAAMGFGIMNALKATNAASKAAWSASAAAGAAALASTALVAAGVIAASTGWTGIGLIAAAVTAVIGTVLDMVIKPEGPSLSVRAGGGLNIGTADGRLQVQGDLGSRVTRREGVDRGMAQEVQQRLEEGITNAVLSIVQTINAVALDPAALAQPTQEALQKALKNLQPINTANAKKMERDIAEQLRFANLAIIGGLLEPVNLAFDQLRDQGDLTEQLDRLPGTTAGLVAVFKTMNEQLDEIAKSENTDVLRQLSGVRNQVENFGNRIAGTAGQIAENIVTGIIDSFTTKVDTDLAGQITEFSTLMASSIRALGLLRNTKTTLEQAGLGGGAVGSQIDRLAQATGEAAGRISTQIVSTALGELSARLDQVLIQPIRIQATTVNSLFNDSLAALNALWTEWHALEDAGIDAAKVREQFTRLLGGIIESALSVLNNAFTSGSFSEFLAVLVSIPDEVAKLNPKLAELKALGVAFAQVVGPINQAIETMEESMRTTAERVTFTETRMGDLRDAIADAGNAADRALPLYAQLATAIQANGQAQIDAANEVADAQIKAANEAADAQIKAANEAAEASLKAVNVLASALTKQVNEWADLWTKAINDAADAAVKWVNDWADAWTTAINNAADMQIASVNEWADAWTKAVNDAAEAQRAWLAQWVEDMTNAVNTWAELANTTASQLRTVTEAILAEQSPRVQQQALLEQEAMLNAVIAAGGPGAQEAMSELIRVEQQLLALAKQSNSLKGQQDAINKLEAIQKALREQLIALTGQSDPILAQIAVAAEQKRLLKEIDAFNKWYSQYLTDVQAIYLDLIAKEQARQIDAINVQREAELKAIADLRDSYIAGINRWRDEELKGLALARDFLLQAIDQLATAEITTINNARDAQILAINTARDAEVKAINDARDEQVKAIKVDVINQLKALEAALKTLFAGQDVVGGTLHVPVPVRMTQRGGMMAYAQGGMVPAMLEPREQVFTPPLGMGQQRALGAMNAAFPRFASGGWTVPGGGSGDTVPMLLPRGSFVLNRNAAGAMGFQGGGMVQGRANGTSVVVNVDLRGATVRNQGDYLKLTQEFRDAVRSALIELERRSPRRGK